MTIPPRHGEGDHPKDGGGASPRNAAPGGEPSPPATPVPLPVPGRNDWLHVARSNSPLILAFPHGGLDLPPAFAAGFRSPRWATSDADWHIRQLYDGLADATLVWTDISRSIVDCNRDPSGASLYPGQATTGLCPTETFDGEPLYGDPSLNPAHPELVEGSLEPPGQTLRQAQRERGLDDAESALRHDAHHAPYHAALAAEIARLRALHPRVVLYDCHSIRSRVPRLFEGDLPELNIGTDNGRTCAPELERAVAEACAATGRSFVVNGRFRGGWTTRHYGPPEEGVHAIQMELAMRAYLREPEELTASPEWPPRYDPDYAEPLREDLRAILAAVSAFLVE